MPRCVGSALWKMWFFFSFPSLLLAVSLDVPTRSSVGETIYLTWMEDIMDPDSIHIKIICDLRTVGETTVPTRTLQASLTADPALSTARYVVCNVVAYDPGDLAAAIGESPSFEAFPVNPSLNLKHLSIEVQSKTLDLSSSTNIPVSSTSPSQTTPKFSTKFPTSTPSVSAITSLEPPRTSASSITPPDLDGESSASTTGGMAGDMAGGTTGGVAGDEQFPTFPATNQNTNTRIFPLSGSSSDAVPTTSAVGGSEPGGDRRPGSGGGSSSSGAIVGGIFGGMASVLLGYVVFILYSRYKSGRDARGCRRLLAQRDEEAAQDSPILSSPSSPPFYRRAAYDTAAHPLTYSEDYQPPEGKREQLERVQREMEETQRQREILQLDLEMRRNESSVGAASAGKVDNEVERLKHHIEQMNGRIGELEQEEELPPDYYSSGSGH